MRKNALIALILFLSCSHLYGQRAVAKLNLAGILQKKYGGAFEFAFNQRFSGVLEAAYIMGSSEGGTGLTSTSEKGFAVMPQARYYFPNQWTNAPQGLFAGLNVVYEKFNINVDSSAIQLTSGNAQGLGYGLLIGHQWVFSNRFSIELFYNGYYNDISLTGPLGSPSTSRDIEIANYYLERKGIRHRIGISLGVAF